MKILGSLFRLLCALVVLLAIAVYADGSLQASLVDYIAAFTPEHLQTLANPEGWPVITAAALVLLTLCCGMTLGWNIAYSLATIAFFAEAALLVLGPELALPTAARGLGWEPLLREAALNYPVPTLMIPAFCILGCLCSNAPVRIAWTSLLGCALCYGCAELLHYGVGLWQAMPEPVLPHGLELVKSFPWVLVALPAVFFLQYCLFMAMFEAIAPRRKKKAKAEKKEDAVEDKPAAPAEPESAPAATLPAIPTPVVVKRPVVHKKSPVNPTPEEKKEEEAPKAEEAEAPEAPAPEAEEEPAAPAEPAPEKKPEEAPEAPAEAAAEEPAAEEKAEDAPATPIPSVPLPPAPQAEA